MTGTKLNIELKSIKIIASMSEETICFTANLYLNGKKSGTVKNDGQGGCNSYYLNKGDMGRIQEYIQTLPPIDTDFGNIEVDIDWYLGDILAKYQEDKTFKRYCKTKTVYILKETPEGSVVTIPRKFTPTVEIALQEKYGDNLVEIINKRYVKEGK